MKPIIIEPSYDSYIPSIVSFGGTVKTFQLQPPLYAVDWDAVEGLVTPQTKLIMINTPHNPCGVVLTPEDLLLLEHIVLKYGLYVISDEVYEHIIFDGHQHQSVLRFPQLYQRTFVVFSFGKSLHVTGWKTGYVIAPPDINIRIEKDPSIQCILREQAYANRDRSLHAGIRRLWSAFFFLPGKT
jgi:methionine aminotransferase